jgi:hypothetical protein
MELKPISTYGIHLSEFDKLNISKRRYDYMKALVNAELLNPDSDWDSERFIDVLKQIAESDLTQTERTELVCILKNK